MSIVPVPDPRLKTLNDIIATQKVIPAAVSVDIAGLVKGASKGEGLEIILGTVEPSMLHVVRCFGADIHHVDGSVDPIRDIETIDLELIFKDLESVEKRISRLTKIARSGDKAANSMSVAEKMRIRKMDNSSAVLNGVIRNGKALLRTQSSPPNRCYSSVMWMKI